MRETMRETLEKLTTTEAIAANLKESFFISDADARDLAEVFKWAISAPSKRQMEERIKEYQRKLRPYKKRPVSEDLFDELDPLDIPELDPLDFPDLD